MANRVHDDVRFLGLILAAAMATACSQTPADRFLGDETKPQSAAELEANTKVRLPAGTVLLSAARTSLNGGLEARTTAQFRMPATALPEFLTDSGFTDPEPGKRTVADADFPNSQTWRPDKAATVSGTTKDNRRVMVDLGHPEDVTVYLVAFEF